MTTDVADMPIFISSPKLLLTAEAFVNTWSDTKAGFVVLVFETETV